MGTLSPKSIKILKTCNLYLCFFTLGMCLAIPGPCLLDLQHVVHTEIEQIAFIYTSRAIGYLVGSILGGIVLDAVKSKQAVMTICSFIGASTMLATPWSRSLPTLAAFMIVNGISLGTVCIGGNVVCLTLWGGDGGPFYQALHFNFGLGGLVAPLIAAPFLGDYSEEDYSTMHGDNATYPENFTNFKTEFFDNNTSTSDAIPSIIYPFSIIGGFGLLVTIMFLAVCIVSPTEEKRSQNQSKGSPNSSLGFLSIVVFLACLLLFVEGGIEIGYGQTLTTYVVKGRLKLASAVGSYMTSAFWGSYTVSRFASVFLAIKVKSFTLIAYDIAISMAGALVLLLLASYEWALWLASVLLGIGIASFFPSTIAWLDTYIDVTNKIASLFTVGACFGDMVIPFTITYFIDSFPDVLIYVVSTSCFSCALIVLILHLILRKRETKTANKEPECFVIGDSSVKTANKEPECFVIGDSSVNT